MRRVKLLVGAAVVAAVALTGLPAGTTAVGSSPVATAHGSSAGEPDYRFLSAPDFLNADVGNVTRSARWRPGCRAPRFANGCRSVNWHHWRALGTVMNHIARHRPDDVLVAGDLVNGRWGADQHRTGTFGRARTYPQRRSAVWRAAKVYYGQWRQRFVRRGIPVHAAIGDHDIGDDPWDRRSAYSNFRRNSLHTFKAAYAQHIVAPHRYTSRPPWKNSRRTAYSTRLHPEVLLVSLDVFRSPPGVKDVWAEVDHGQLVWLRRVLARAQRDGVDWVVVQGHTPIVGPVRTKGSSSLMYRKGTRSALWRTMVRHGVDLYLSGEVHAITAHHVAGVTQVAHGGLFAYGGTNYLVGDVHGDRLELRSIKPRGWYNPTKRLWQAVRGGIPAYVRYGREQTKGTMVLTREGEVRSATGCLALQRPGRRPTRC